MKMAVGYTYVHTTKNGFRFCTAIPDSKEEELGKLLADYENGTITYEEYSHGISMLGELDLYRKEWI